MLLTSEPPRRAIELTKFLDLTADHCPATSTFMLR
jgi:hypothetical protein